MTRTITRLGDRVLTRVLRQEKAGACVPPDPCGLAFSHNYCNYSQNQLYAQYCPGKFNCAGTCVPEYSQGAGCVSHPTGQYCS